MKKRSRILTILLTTFLVVGGIIFFLIQKQEKSLNTKQISTHQPTKRREKNTPPTPYFNNNFSPKTLANVIKADLQDASTNKSRWGSGYFNDYLVYDKGDIWRHGINYNKNLTRELTENFNRNYVKRKAKHEQDKREYEAQGHTYPKSLDNYWDEKEKEMIWLEDLEPQDYQEIVNLIFWIKCLAKEDNEKKMGARKEKFACNPNYFEWGTGTDKTFIDSSGVKRKYHIFVRWENQKVFNVNIPESHPSLNNFPFRKSGFYLISGLDKLSWEPSPYNGHGTQDFFAKWVGFRDKITINPLSL